MVGNKGRAASATTWRRLSLKNGSAPTSSARVSCCVMAAKAASISPVFDACSIWISCPAAAAACGSSSSWRSASGPFGLISTAIGPGLGITSRSRPNRLPPRASVRKLTPVILPPGRFRLATKPASTGVAAHGEDDRSRRGPCFCRAYRRRAAGGDDHVHPRLDQLRYQPRQSRRVIVAKAIFDGHGPAFKIASLGQTFTQGRDDVRAPARFRRIEETDNRSRLLRAPQAAPPPPRRPAT